jgi:hypothetical protein
LRFTSLLKCSAWGLEWEFRARSKLFASTKTP